jgi:Cap4 dsDNA endonuclease
MSIFSEVESASWPSIDLAKPPEEGGPIARTGFNYQDEVAVSFLIDMLCDSTHIKIHLETHDDIVAVRRVDSVLIAEFVQVKAAELNKLWSIADLCRRENGLGTSIFEAALNRDKHEEISRFRIVTLRPVVDELKFLTFLPGAVGREPCCSRFLTLLNELKNRFPDIYSPKRNGASYWLKHCLWDVRHSEQSLASSNFDRLLRFAHAEGKALLSEQVDALLDELRALAKEAGAARWEPNRSNKIIFRDSLCTWWTKRTIEILDGAGAASGGKLRIKMRAANLGEDQVRMAVELRQEYAKFIRTSRYMEDEFAQRLQSRVKSELASLRARFVAGQIQLDPTAFYALCVERMNSINSERPAGTEDHSAFLIGCMYDIADRCLHQFARPRREIA